MARPDRDVQKCEHIIRLEQTLDMYYHRLADDIRAYRIKNKVSMRVFGSMIGCSGMNVCHIENLVLRPNREMMIKINKALTI